MANLGLWPTDSNNETKTKKSNSKKRKKEAGNDQDSFISEDEIFS